MIGVHWGKMSGMPMHYCVGKPMLDDLAVHEGLPRRPTAIGNSVTLLMEGTLAPRTIPTHRDQTSAHASAKELELRVT